MLNNSKATSSYQLWLKLASYEFSVLVDGFLSCSFELILMEIYAIPWKC